MKKNIIAAALALTVMLGITPSAMAAKSLNQTPKESNNTSEVSITVSDLDEAGRRLIDENGGNVEYPANGEYLSAEGDDLQIYLNGYEDFDVAYVKGDNVNGYYAPDGKKVITELLDGSPVIILAARDEYYCVIDYCSERASWVKKSMIDKDYYKWVDRAESMRDELTSWRDIERVYANNFDSSPIIGIKKDGTVVTTGGCASIENWGKLKDLYTYYSIPDMIYGITEDGEVKIYSNYYYPQRAAVEEEYEEYGIELSDEIYDLRYIKDAKKLLGREYGMACLTESGELLPILWDSGLVLKEFDDRPYAFTKGGVWNYVDLEADGKRILYTEKDGKIDWSRGKDVSNDEAYDFSSMTKGIKDVRAKYPDEAFTALYEDGSVLLYGFMAKNLDDREGTGVEANLEFDGLSSLISMDYGIKDGKIVSLIKEGQESAYRNETPILDAEIYSGWDDICYAVIDSFSLIAVDRDGKTYVNTNLCSSWLEMPDYGQYDIENWKNLNQILTVTDFADLDYAYTLGVTEEGRVQISGILPDERA